MAVEMMDAYLSKAYIKLHEFELLAITSLFISTKYEEVQITLTLRSTHQR